ncbi:aldehyde dehydrogenase [Streptomyces sp. NPDC093085]|uniref:aldehyde dehydrogenase family protein n=1 Tax=Streptomyces sp. NPDC093085 TaxID=3155068 RepID=UPI003429FE4B
MYVVDSDALLDDAFATLTLKRKLESGRLPAENLPPTIVGRVARADRAATDLAVEAAAAAAPVWGTVDPETRIEEFGTLLYRRLADQAERITEVLVQEGHPLALARWQVSGALEVFGPESLGFYRSQMLQEYRHGERVISVRRRPDGVVCLNPPQNAPLSSALLGVTAIMAGNALVVRAPRSAPLGVMYVLQEVVAPVLAELGAPAGTLGVVCGDPAPMLDAWLESPLVDDIMYFGSSENGMRFQERCIAAGKKPILELAGNDIVLVWKDADLELAAEAITESFYGSGQLCMIPNQVVAHPEIADRLLELLAARAAEIRPGRSSEEGVLLTPVLRNEKFFACLRDAVEHGAEVVCGGHAVQADGVRDTAGIFLEPTVVKVRGLAGAREVAAVRDETFFPLLPVIVAEPGADDELLERFLDFVNGNAYGLRNSAWARDPAVIDRIVTRITQGGLLKVNDSHIGFLPYLPTHGGTGLTGGVFGEANYPILRTSHIQGVSVATGARPSEAVFGAWRALKAATAGATAAGATAGDTAAEAAAGA